MKKYNNQHFISYGDKILKNLSLELKGKQKISIHLRVLRYLKTKIFMTKIF